MLQSPETLFAHRKGVREFEFNRVLHSGYVHRVSSRTAEARSRQIEKDRLEVDSMDSISVSKT